MNINEYITGISSLVALITGCVALYIAWRKSKPEVENLRADAASKWQILASKAAEQVEKLTLRVDALERLTDAQEERIRCLETENADLRDWADRLVHQLKARQIEPVEMRKSTLKADTQPLDKTNV